jgi:amino acid transporter
MNVLSGLVATVLMIVAFQITGANSGRYFAAVLGLTISTTTISYLFIFPALIKLRYSRPDVPRPYRVPGGMVGAWICSVVPTFWALLATVALIWPGFGVNWFGAGGSGRHGRRGHGRRGPGQGRRPDGVTPGVGGLDERYRTCPRRCGELFTEATGVGRARAGPPPAAPTP